MKNKKQFRFAMISILVLSMLVLLVIPIFNNITTVNAATIKINKENISLNVGKTFDLKITGTSKAAKWSTSNSSVAAVSNAGKVTAKKKGTVTITATVNNKKYTCKVTIPSKYKNGVFEGSGTGFRNGTTTVSVTIKNDIIMNVEVLSNEDTPRFFDNASSQVISDILNTQSADVDAVSRATYSSVGIMDAVKNALEKAKN